MHVFREIINISKKTFPFVKKYKHLIILNFIFTQFAMLLKLLLPLFTKYLIDDIVYKSEWDKLTPFFISLFIVYILYGILNILSGFMYADFSESIYSDARKDAFRKIFNKKMSFFEKYTNGELITRMTQDSGYLHTILSYVLSEFTVSVLQILVVFIILFKLNFIFAVIVLITVPVFYLTNKYFGEKLKKIIQKVRTKTSEYNDFIISHLTNILLIKNYNIENDVSAKSDELSDKLKFLQNLIDKDYFLKKINFNKINAVTRK